MGVRIGTHSQPASPGAQPSQAAPEPGPAQPSLEASLPHSIRKPGENKQKTKNKNQSTPFQTIAKPLRKPDKNLRNHGGQN